jgi:alpha-maltose-1-phosphate synthase
MGNAGRARVMKIFNWEKSAEQAVAIYEEILTERLRHSPRPLYCW